MAFLTGQSARTQLLVHRTVGDQNKDSSTILQTGMRITRGLVSSVVQANATAHERG